MFVELFCFFKCFLFLYAGTVGYSSMTLRQKWACQYVSGALKYSASNDVTYRVSQIEKFCVLHLGCRFRLLFVSWKLSTFLKNALSSNDS